MTNFGHISGLLLLLLVYYAAATTTVDNRQHLLHANNFLSAFSPNTGVSWLVDRSSSSSSGEGQDQTSQLIESSVLFWEDFGLLISALDLSPSSSSYSTSSMARRHHNLLLSSSSSSTWMEWIDSATQRNGSPLRAQGPGWSYGGVFAPEGSTSVGMLFSFTSQVDASVCCGPSSKAAGTFEQTLMTPCLHATTWAYLGRITHVIQTLKINPIAIDTQRELRVLDDFLMSVESVEVSDGYAPGGYYESANQSLSFGVVRTRSHVVLSAIARSMWFLFQMLDLSPEKQPDHAQRIIRVKNLQANAQRVVTAAYIQGSHIGVNTYANNDMVAEGFVYIGSFDKVKITSYSSAPSYDHASLQLEVLSTFLTDLDMIFVPKAAFNLSQSVLNVYGVMGERNTFRGVSAETVPRRGDARKNIDATLTWNMISVLRQLATAYGGWSYARTLSQQADTLNDTTSSTGVWSRSLAVEQPNLNNTVLESSKGNGPYFTFLQSQSAYNISFMYNLPIVAPSVRATAWYILAHADETPLRVNPTGTVPIPTDGPTASPTSQPPFPTSSPPSSSSPLSSRALFWVIVGSGIGCVVLVGFAFMRLSRARRARRGYEEMNGASGLDRFRSEVADNDSVVVDRDGSSRPRLESQPLGFF